MYYACTFICNQYYKNHIDVLLLATHADFQVGGYYGC